MFALRNRVTLIGHLGGKPNVTSTMGGKKRAVFSVATNESYRNQSGELIENTQWHRVVTWGKIAEVAERFLDKGREVAIEGKLVHRSYTDQAGVEKYITEVQANELLLLGKKPA